jgi:hypothetical protein
MSALSTGFAAEGGHGIKAHECMTRLLPNKEDS